MIEEGRNGLLCKPGDPEDLAQKIFNILEDKNHAFDMGMGVPCT